MDGEVVTAGDFEVVLNPPLAQGTGCVILNGKQISTGKECVIKKLQLSDFEIPYADEFFRRFSNEIRIMQEMDQYNDGLFPKYIGTGKLNGMPFIALEKINGKTLFDLLQDPAISNADRLRYCIDVLKPLAEIHRRQKVHRDIKPSNIMVRGDGSVVLLDFSISKGMGQTLQTRKAGVVLATVGYAPEQQLVDSANAEPWWDNFAWAVTVYKVIVGKDLFEIPQNSEETVVELIRQQKTLKPVDVVRDLTARGVSKSIARFVSEVLADKGERFPNARVVMVEVQRLGEKRMLLLKVALHVAAIAAVAATIYFIVR